MTRQEIAQWIAAIGWPIAIGSSFWLVRKTRNLIIEWTRQVDREVKFTRDDLSQRITALEQAKEE